MKRAKNEVRSEKEVFLSDSENDSATSSRLDND
jgi:hypothetical protein